MEIFRCPRQPSTIVATLEDNRIIFQQADQLASPVPKMSSSAQRKAAMRAARRQAARRRGIYVLAGLVLIVTVVSIGVYIYVSGQSSNMNANPDIVYAKINTTKGLIQVELYQSKVPKTVTNFVNLANSGFYNNLVWHRIVKDFVIQTGDPNTRGGTGSNSTWGTGGSGQTIPLEIDSSLHNNAGYLGMARGTDKNSATSQFYINLIDNSSTLDARPGFDGYAVFGKVTSGVDVVNAIGIAPNYGPPNNYPIDPTSVMVTSITISNTP